MRGFVIRDLTLAFHRTAILAVDYVAGATHLFQVVTNRDNLE